MTKTRLAAYGGMQIPILGKCKMNVKSSRNEVTADFYVVKADKSRPLSGLETCHNLELITVGKNVSEIKKGDEDIRNEFKDVS